MTDAAHEDPPDRLDTHEALLRRLIGIADHHRTITDDLRATIVELRIANRAQQAMNQRQEAFNADVTTTLARIETLLDRMIRPADTGRDA